MKADGKGQGRNNLIPVVTIRPPMQSRWQNEDEDENEDDPRTGPDSLTLSNKSKAAWKKRRSHQRSRRKRFCSTQARSFVYQCGVSD